MHKGLLVYRGTTLAEKTAIFPAQIRENIEYMMRKGEHYTIDGASVILADLCSHLLGLRRAEFFASAEKSPNRTTLLCFRNFEGLD